VDEKSESLKCKLFRGVRQTCGMSINIWTEARKIRLKGQKTEDRRQKAEGRGWFKDRRREGEKMRGW